MYIDTHLHISDAEGINPDIYVENAKQAGVEYLVASFCEKNSIELSTYFGDKYNNLYSSVGYHPDEANDIKEEDLEKLELIIKNKKKIVAVGEIGLDYYWHKDNKEKQKELFHKQLSLAIKYNLPVVIHSRDSIGDVYEILKEYPLKGIIHCFSGSLEMAREFIKLGYLLGIGGVVTFKNSKLDKVIEQIPLESIVLETDSPYLSPEPNRGKVNQSSNIPYIALKIAKIKNIPISKVQETTTENASRIFDLGI